jgi:predicted thioesterase
MQLLCILAFYKANIMTLKKGLFIEKSKEVQSEDSAMRYGSGMVDVLATPAMIAFMEECSMELLLQFLPEGYNSVGTEVNIKHLKATPIGMKIRCRAEILENDDKSVLLKVEAYDEEGKIGEGNHRRFLVNVERFMKKFQS